MEVATPTLAEQLAVPLVMLLCTTVLALIGFLLSYQLKQRDEKNKDQDEELEDLKAKMIQVRHTLRAAGFPGFQDKPSDSVKKKGPS